MFFGTGIAPPARSPVCLGVPPGDTPLGWGGGVES